MTMGAKNKLDVLTGAVYASMVEVIDYNSPDRDAACAVLGVDAKSYGTERILSAWEAYAKIKPADMAKLIYAFFGDSEKEDYTIRYSTHNEFPKYGRCLKMEILYNWLCSLGYQMSDEETAMMNGTHEVYRRGEAAE